MWYDVLFFCYNFCVCQAWLFPSILRAEAPLKRPAFQRSTVDLQDTVTQPYTDSPEPENTIHSLSPSVLDTLQSVEDHTGSEEILDKVPDVDLGMYHSVEAVSPSSQDRGSMELMAKLESSGQQESNSQELLRSPNSSEPVKSYGSVQENSQ